MSVSSVGSGSLPDPAFYGYTPGLPAGLAHGDAPAPGPSTGSVSPYVAEYGTLQQQDAAELLQVSLGSAANAQSNVASVLAQAAALQAKQVAAQQQAAASAAQTDSAASMPDPLSAIPSFESIVSASDAAATGASETTGSNVDTLA